MIIAKVLLEEFEKNPNTKTTYNKTDENILFQDAADINKLYIDSMKFFRNLGGSETVTRGYTFNGYCPIKLTSTSPNREYKKIRYFKYIPTTRFYGKRITRFINIESKLYYGYSKKNGNGVILFETPKKATKKQMINNF